jgi:hypothetical protein
VVAAGETTADGILLGLTVNGRGRPMVSSGGTGNVSSRRGNVRARSINTGLLISGSVDTQVLREASAALQHLRSGSVSASKDVIADEINVGISYRSENLLTGVAEQLHRLRGALERAVEATGAREVQDAVVVVDKALREVEAPQDTDSVPLLDRIGTVLTLLSTAASGVVATAEAGNTIASGIEAAWHVYQSIASAI